MVLQNHVILQDNQPARMHFTDHHIEARTITDPNTLQPAIRRTLVFNVDRLNGAPTQAVLSTMAENLASQFAPYLDDKSYVNYEVIVTQRGVGYTRKWTVQFIPFSK